MLGSERGQDALLITGTARVRNVVKLLVELDGCLGRAVLEATQAAGIDMQQLSDERHVPGCIAECPPDPHPRCISEQAVDQRSPLKSPLPRHRRGIDAIADLLPIVHEGARIVLGLVHQR